jgi:protein phosphatase-4 regulatory subunit 3
VSDAQQRLGLVNGGGRISCIAPCATSQLTGLTDDGLSDEIIDPIQGLILPEPDMGNLADIENTMRMANSTAHGRDTLARYVMSNDYISKLVPLVQMAEDFESLPDLHRLCNIMKTVILLNDNSIIEQVVKDDLILGVVGALECKAA